MMIRTVHELSDGTYIDVDQIEYITAIKIHGVDTNKEEFCFIIRFKSNTDYAVADKNYDSLFEERSVIIDKWKYDE
jgi:hypothetical protein